MPAAQHMTGSMIVDLQQIELHWLDVAEKVQFKLAVSVHRCLQRKAPQYLIDHCTSVLDIASQQDLRSASHHQLIVPRYRYCRFGRLAVAVAGQMVWNTLPDDLRDSGRSSESFRCSLTTFSFSSY